MKAWRGRPLRERPLAWCLQETHVSGVDQAKAHSLQWAQLWGKHTDPSHPPLSYWSTGSSQAGKVAILLNPKSALDALVWEQDLWGTREIALSINGFVLLNVYAPTLRAEREDFFSRLPRWSLPRDNSIILGDFNCVQSPLLDRLGPHRSCRPESPALEAFLDQREWADARLMRDHAEDEEADDTVDHFTYWEGSRASRIDRFYVPRSWVAQVLWVTVRTPPYLSDHQEVELHLRGRCQPSRPPKGRQVIYPIQGSQPDRVLEELFVGLTELGVGRTSSVRHWDSIVAACKLCIARVRKRARQRRYRYKTKLLQRERRQFLTRHQWITANMEELRLEHSVRIGQRLERTTASLRWSYKRVSDWERDQTVSRIVNLHGPKFTRPMTVAAKFSSEWSPLLGRIHRTEPLSSLQAAIQVFVTVPDERRLSSAANAALVAEITEAEVLQAVSELSRHKTAGPDGLNNDFFKDTSALMVPALLTVSNEILFGAPMPPSFLEALVIPLRKKGDSSDALDYRPISLLQTSYKIFAKVLATRLQTVLPRLVGDSQQGFVRGRQMRKLVTMMLSQITSASDEVDLPASASRVILLLDFRKAYDTVDREFLYAALRAFHFDDRFIHLIQRMHTGTTARFSVNGEQSDPIAVRSGIRQGCPLAPLLFLLVVELLGLAIHQDPGLRGLPVPGDPGVRHIFSAFVDDSTLFLERADQLEPALRVVHRFGELSGLHAQPTNSQIIFLNTSVRLEQYRGITVLPPAATTRYLGYEIGTGEMLNHNWAQRIRRSRRRLLTATSVATSVQNRVIILNTIILPAVLFTAAVFDIPAWASSELDKLYRQFLWQHASDVEVRRHKINPGLLVTPAQAGGVGIASFQVAIKTQRTKHALKWLLNAPDKYSAAWRSTTILAASSVSALVPALHRDSGVGRPLRQRHKRDHVVHDLEGFLAPTLDQVSALRSRVETHHARLVGEATSWWVGRQWVLRYREDFPDAGYADTPREMAIGSFWDRFHWNDNPWIVDINGKPLQGSRFARLPACQLRVFNIHRTGLRQFVFTMPRSSDTAPRHLHPKLRRWATIILLASPAISVGSGLAAPELTLRHPPPPLRDYRWIRISDQMVEGKPPDCILPAGPPLRLRLGDSGLHWFVCPGDIPEFEYASSREANFWRQRISR